MFSNTVRVHQLCNLLSERYTHIRILYVVIIHTLYALKYNSCRQSVLQK